MLEISWKCPESGPDTESPASALITRLLDGDSSWAPCFRHCEVEVQQINIGLTGALERALNSDPWVVEWRSATDVFEISGSATKTVKLPKY